MYFFKYALSSIRNLTFFSNRCMGFFEIVLRRLGGFLVDPSSEMSLSPINTVSTEPSWLPTFLDSVRAGFCRSNGKGGTSIRGGFWTHTDKGRFWTSTGRSCAFYGFSHETEDDILSLRLFPPSVSTENEDDSDGEHDRLNLFE